MKLRCALLLPLLLAGASARPALGGPQAAPTAVPASGRAPLTVTFSPHVTDGSFYQWQFDAAGSASFSPDFSSDVAENVTYTFQVPGAYVTRLRIYDALSGLPADFDLPVTVLPPVAPPVVTLSHAPIPVLPGGEVTLTASATTAPGQAVLSYFWDLNADGVADFQSPGGPTASIVQSFATIAAHPVAVTAVDGAGLAGRAETVVKPGLPPTPLIDAPNPVLRGPGVDADFTARIDGKSASWPVVSYDWDFGDGQTGSAPGPGPATVTHAYAAVGSYTATLTLTDEAGHTATRTRQVLIADGPTIRLDATNSGKSRTGDFYAQAVPPPGLSIASYVWDFGDGETLTEPGGPQSHVLHTYGAGVYTVTVTAVDSVGGTQTAQQPFNAPSVVPKEVGKPAPPPPPLSVSLSYQVDGVNGGSARAGHRFVFTAQTHSNVGLPSDPYGRLLWDFDGDLQRDRTDDLGGAVDLTTTASWQYSTPGTHWVTVRAILLGTGLVHEARLGVTVLPPVAPLECWIVQPRDGARVWGNSVTLSARTSPAGLTRRVDFAVRPEGSAGPWIRVGRAVPPPYSALSATWDTTRFAPGRYELRAEATDVDGVESLSTALHPVTVEVDPAAPSISEDGAARVEVIDPNGATRSEVAQDLALDLPPYAFGTHARIRIERPTGNPHPLEARFQGLNFIPGSFRRLSLVGVGALERPSRITLYSLNPDGVLDGLGVDPAKLSIWQFDGSAGKWVPLYAQLTQPGEDLIRATLNAMGDVGIVAARTERVDDGSSDPVCGALGAEVVLLAALLLRRRRRSLVRAGRAG